MRFLFLFLDGVGLGEDNPEINPFSLAKMPRLTTLLSGRRLVTGSAPYEGPKATLLSLDACLNVSGLPQSATGQAVLLTGQNVPASLGYHYGPKPNPDVAAFLRNSNLFSQLQSLGMRTALLNAYPPRYFDAISSGHRIYSAIPLAATSAKLTLKDYQSLINGEAIAADFTAQGWRDYLGLAETPVISAWSAGQTLAKLANEYDFSFFEYWLSDYSGHRQDMQEAVKLLESLDRVLGGLINSWDDQHGLILITSDHGNLENLNTRRHTLNPVPALIIGSPYLRARFCRQMKSILDVAPAIVDILTNLRQ